MSIGYACISIGAPNTQLKSCILKNVSKARLMNLIEHNLEVLNNQINYNIDNKIKLFRISSDLIPFGSHSVNKLNWWEIYDDRFKEIGTKIIENGIRVSMHPGQYTVLNSPNRDVVERSIKDLQYHTRVLDSLGMPSCSKVILHIGGTYGNKESAIKGFKDIYQRLDFNIKDRLVIENDEKSYNIEDVLNISENLKIPVIFDNLHHLINPPEIKYEDRYWIQLAQSTWKEKDGKQKIHFSQQKPNGKTGSHSDTIEILGFLDYYREINGENLDIMLEVKDKDLSALKCIHCTLKEIDITILEKQWAKYKYTILARNASYYNKIRQLLKDKNNPNPLDFYLTIEKSYLADQNKGAQNNAILHVWGYFKNITTDRERRKFYNLQEKFMVGQVKINTVKGFLHRLADKYNKSYLLNSYYFNL